MLDDADRDVLARYRAAKSPSNDETTQALWRMRTRLKSGAPPMELDEVPERSGTGLQWAAVAVAIAAVLALALSLSFGGVLSTERDGGSAELEAPYVGERETAGGVAAEGRRDEGRERSRRPRARRDDAVPLAEPAVETETVPEPIDEPATDDDGRDDEPETDDHARDDGDHARNDGGDHGGKTRRRPKPAPREEPPPEPAPDATLAAEMALLRAAQGAIAGGNAKLALQKLGHHARTFPKSQLAPERELARVRALCALGRTSEAERAAKKFRKRHGGSHLDKVLDKTCVGDDSKD